MADYITLTDFANLSQEPKIMKVVESLYNSGSVQVRDIPFAVKKSQTVSGARFDGNLPTVTWLNKNDTTIPSHSTTASQFQERAFLVREHVKTDVADDQDENAITDPHAFNVNAFLLSFAYDFNDKFINNNHITGDTKAFVGLRERLDDPSEYGTTTANKIDAGGATADMSVSGATAKTFGAFCEKLDEMLWRMNSPEGDSVVLYMAQQLKWRISMMARQFSGQGGFGQSTDQLGRSVTTYKNAVVREIGLKSDQSTNIITMTEEADGDDGASTFTSIYGARYSNDGVQGWTHLPLDIRPVNDANGTHKISLIEWMGGLLIPDSKAVSRLYDIKVS